MIITNEYDKWIYSEYNDNKEILYSWLKAYVDYVHDYNNSIIKKQHKDNHIIYSNQSLISWVLNAILIEKIPSLTISKKFIAKYNVDNNILRSDILSDYHNVNLSKIYFNRYLDELGIVITI